MADPQLHDLVFDPVITYRIDDGSILAWNEAASIRYGIAAPEVVGRRIDDVLTRTFADSDAAETLLRRGWWQGDVRIVTRDGRVFDTFCRQRTADGTIVFEVHGPVAARAAVDLRLVIDNLPGLVSYVDRDFRYRFANHVYCEWFGVPEAELVGALVEDVLGREAFARVRPQMELALRGETIRFDTYLPYARGSGKHVTVSYVPDRDTRQDSGTGDVPGFVVLVEDNSARHEAQEALRASEARYRRIIESSHEGIWIIGEDARTVFANEQMAALLRTTVDRMYGAPSFEYVFEEDASDAGALFARKMSGDREPFEFRLRRADGTAMWTRVSGVPIPDANGQSTGLLGLFTDITDARASEAALRESETRFRTLLENLPDIVSRFDRSGRFLYISPAVEPATGLRPEAYVGKTHAEAGVPEPLASKLSAALDGIFDFGATTTIDFEMPTPSGELRAYHGLGVPERGDDGAVETVLTIVRDVSEQKRAEAALRRSHAELERFAYAAAHDLQEPLRVISIYTEMFLRRHAQGVDAEALEGVGFIRRAIQHMQELIRDLLSYSKAVHDESHLSAKADLGAALDEAVAALHEMIENSAATIERAAMPIVLGDERQFTQVLVNLLSNALKYRADGQKPRIRISAERAGSEWVISVEDSGIGFNPAYSEQIFGLFKRLHRDAYPGTGVGLGICRLIVERNGGRIWAESEGEGRGATFRFSAAAADAV